MAIAFDAATAGGFTAGTSHSFAHTCSGADRIVFVITWGGVGVASDITDVTYNGVALTKIGEVAAETSIRNVALWYLVAPATGSNTVAITGTGGLTDACGGAAASYTGAKQTGVPDSFGTTFGTSVATLTASTTVVAADCWVTGGGQNSGGACVAGAGTIMRVAAANSENYGDSNGTVGTGSQSLTFDDAGGGNMAMVIASFEPSTGGGGGAPSKQLMMTGVG